MPLEFSEVLSVTARGWPFLISECLTSDVGLVPGKEPDEGVGDGEQTPLSSESVLFEHFRLCPGTNAEKFEPNKIEALEFLIVVFMDGKRGNDMTGEEELHINDLTDNVGKTSTPCS